MQEEWYTPTMSRATLSNRFGHLLPAPRGSGFRIDGYFVWDGSVISADGQYHMFASRWPKRTRFPDGYMQHSEIVRAVSDRLEGPYAFAEVVLPGRGGEYWDGGMTHNPKVLRCGDTYVLFHNGAPVGKTWGHRNIGYAWTKAITGPWTRMDAPLTVLGRDTNNPAPLLRPDGSILLAYRYNGAEMDIGMATAHRFDGEYRLLIPDILPGRHLEDPDLLHLDGTYYIVAEDNQSELTGHSRFGAILQSADAVHWSVADPVTAYTHAIAWEDGTQITAERRERPFYYIDDTGPRCLFTAVLHEGEAWVVAQPLAARAPAP